MVGVRLVFALGLVLAASTQSRAEELPVFDFRNWTLGEEIEAKRSALYALHQSCSVAATRRALSGGESQLCGDVYLELKLTFLRGVTRARYRNMPPKTRATAHDMSYAAYRAWLHRQTTMPRGVGGAVEPGR